MLVCEELPKVAEYEDEKFGIVISDCQITKSNSSKCYHRKINSFEVVPTSESTNNCSRNKQKECKTKYRVESPINPFIIKFQLIHTLFSKKYVFVWLGSKDHNWSILGKLTLGSKLYSSPSLIIFDGTSFIERKPNKTGKMKNLGPFRSMDP